MECQQFRNLHRFNNQINPIRQIFHTRHRVQQQSTGNNWQMAPAQAPNFSNRNGQSQYIAPGQQMSPAPNFSNRNGQSQYIPAGGPNPNVPANPIPTRQSGGGGRYGTGTFPSIGGDQSGLTPQPGFLQQSPTAMHRVDYPATVDFMGNVIPGKTVWLTDDEYNRQQQAIALANKSQAGYSLDNPNPSSDMEQMRSTYDNYDLMRALQSNNSNPTFARLRIALWPWWWLGWMGRRWWRIQLGSYASSPYWAENLNTWNIG